LAVVGSIKIELDLDAVKKYYYKNCLIFDILAVIPVDYIFIFISAVPKPAIAFIRLLRLLKVYRIVEMIQIVRKHSNIRVPLFTLSLLFLLFMGLSHYMACIYIFIGKREVDRKSRFD